MSSGNPESVVPGAHSRVLGHQGSAGFPTGFGRTHIPWPVRTFGYLVRPARARTADPGTSSLARKPRRTTQKDKGYQDHPLTREERQARRLAHPCAARHRSRPPRQPESVQIWPHRSAASAWLGSRRRTLRSSAWAWVRPPSPSCAWACKNKAVVSCRNCRSSSKSSRVGSEVAK